MKRILFGGAFALAVGGQALAADLPPPPAPAPRAPAAYIPVAPPYNWTGIYIGGNLGWGWSQGSFSDPSGNRFSANNVSSFLGGAQVGGNYEFANGVVIGAEADFDWLLNSGNTSNTITGVGPLAGTVALTVNNRWATLVDGRLGYAWDRWLLYAKGGGAWVGANSPGLTINGVSQTINTSGSNWGWTVGGGVEWAFWNNWSVRLEYDYIGLTNQTFTIPAAGNDQFTGSGRNFQMVNLGINYKFGW